jgi:glycosyltransferase involved in cell wall biosynthesis
VRILFLLSCLEPAGSETYCVALEQAWRGKHHVFWISDKLFHGQTYQSMPVHGKAFPRGVLNTLRVARFIRTHRIEVVHSHSRRAHWVAAQAAALTRIAHVTTIHQPLPVHFFSTLFPCLGDETIAIDEVVADHLRRHFTRRPEQIHLIRNGIDLTHAIPSVRQTHNMKRILVIGRLSGGRWPAIQFFLETLERIAKTLPPAHYKIVGRIPTEKHAEFKRLLAQTGAQIAPSTMEALGYVEDLGALIQNADAAIAAGRSALECMAQGRPVIFLGEGGVLGLRKPEIWSVALRTNLGDHLEPKDFNASKLESALRELLSPRANVQELNIWGRTAVEKDFDIRTIASQVERVYVTAAKS